jgi:hypothetical protein
MLKSNKSEMLGPNMADKTALAVAKTWNTWDIIWQQTLIADHLVASLLQAGKSCLE